jgi:lysophospholipase L1-like esterase
VNERGFAGPLVDPGRREGTRRVLCAGESVTFGLSVDPERTFSRELERILSRRGPTEVINAGVIGYTVAQGLHALREQLPLYRPDLVVLLFGALNEQFPAGRVDDEAWIDLLAGAGATGGIARSRVVQALHRLRFSIALRLAPRDHEDLVRRGHRFFDEEGKPTFERRVRPGRFRPLLEEACVAAESAGARVVVVVPPMPPWRPWIDVAGRQVWSEEIYAAICADCRAVGSKPGRALVDGAALLGGDQAVLYFADRAHPNEDGHARLAEAIATASEEGG